MSTYRIKIMTVIATTQNVRAKKFKIQFEHLNAFSNTLIKYTVEPCYNKPSNIKNFLQ